MSTYYYQVLQGGRIYETKRAAMTAARRVKKSFPSRPVPVLIVSTSGVHSVLKVL